MSSLQEELKKTVTEVIDVLEGRKQQIASAAATDKEKIVNDVNAQLEKAKAMKKRVDDCGGDKEQLAKLAEEWKAEAKIMADAGLKNMEGVAQDVQKNLAAAAENMKAKMAEFSKSTQATQ